MSDDLYNKLNYILNRIEGEFADYPFTDKFEWESDYSINYRFENGDTVNIHFENNVSEMRFKSKKNLWALKSNSKNIFEGIETIIGRIDTGSTVRVNNKVAEPVKAIEAGKTIDPRIKEKYNLIIRKIKLRQEQLSKLEVNSGDKMLLVNELNVYKRKADDLKKQMGI